MSDAQHNPHRYPDHSHGPQEGRSTPPPRDARGQPAKNDEPPAQASYKDYRARLDKRDHLLADPDTPLRHHTAMLVKPVDLSPGELAAMGASRRKRQAIVALVVVVVLSAVGLAVVYGPWLAPPPPNLPPPPPDAVLIPPGERPPDTAQPPLTPTPPARPPAFAAVDYRFAGAQAHATLQVFRRPPADWKQDADGIHAPPCAEYQVTWLKPVFAGNLAVEIEVAVAALPDHPDDNAREFRVVFGDGVSDLAGLCARAPSLEGHNRVDIYSADGREVTTYGHNRYGWPFKAGQSYRLKIVREDQQYILSRDGETICSLPAPDAKWNYIGIVAVTGAEIHALTVLPR